VNPVRAVSGADVCSNTQFLCVYELWRVLHFVPLSVGLASCTTHYTTGYQISKMAKPGEHVFVRDRQPRLSGASGGACKKF
jgi:hypothetical protein